MQRPEYVTMSTSELNRLSYMRRLLERRVTQRVVADHLGLSLRQVQRLFAAYKHYGPAGLVSRKRGARGNHRLYDDVKPKAIALIREHYHDFGPTLAREKLFERHGISASVETIRLWMIESEVWVPRRLRAQRSYQPRNRRNCLGELIQIDGSDHEWFEERAPRCSLLVYVDDATGALLELYFAESESTFSYFAATRQYLLRYGKPVAFYSDKHSVFRATNANKHDGSRETQFSRALTGLNIDIICANTPQAKGRVERRNRTLQDRLVKELRLRGISTIEAANAFALEYMADFNGRFAKEPRTNHDAHRPLRQDENLDVLFTLQEPRKLARNLTVHYKRRQLMLEDTVENRDLRGKNVTVYETDNGELFVRHEGKDLVFSVYDKDHQAVDQGAIVDNKRLGAMLAHIAKLQAQREAPTKKKPRTKREKAMHRARKESPMPTVAAK